MISDYKFIDIAIEGRFDIAAFDITTGILDQSIRIQNIVTYLAAERVVHFFAPQLSFPLLFFELVQTTTKYPESRFLVLELGLLVLAGNHDSRRNVSKANSGIGSVDALPAGAACSIHINANIIRIDLHGNIVIGKNRDYLNRSKRGVTTFLVVSR